MLECRMLHIQSESNISMTWNILPFSDTHILKQEIFHFSFLCLIPFDIIYLQFLIQFCTAVLILLLLIYEVMETAHEVNELRYSF